MITKELCPLVKKSLDKKLHNNIFDNYFEKLNQSKEIRKNNTTLQLSSLSLNC